MPPDGRHSEPQRHTVFRYRLRGAWHVVVSPTAETVAEMRRILRQMWQDEDVLVEAHNHHQEDADD